LFRIKKTEITLKMLNDFEEGFENIRSWMDTTEANLQRPFNTQNTNELRLHQQSITVSDLSETESESNRTFPVRVRFGSTKLSKSRFGFGSFSLSVRKRENPEKKPIFEF
jgi:hypothetical protein